MYLGDVLRSLRRRWYLVLVALLIAAAGTFAVSTRVVPSHVSTASIVLVPPVDSEDPQLNRFLDLSNVATSVDVVVRSMSSSTVVADLQDQVPGATYTIATDPATSAPVLLVTSTADDAGPAQEMLEAVLAQVPRSLADIQDEVGIAQSRQITSLVVAQDEEPTVDNSTRVRVLGVAFVGLFGVLLLAIAAYDGIAGRRRSPKDRPGDGRRAETRRRPPSRVPPTKNGSSRPGGRSRGSRPDRDAGVPVGDAPPGPGRS